MIPEIRKENRIVHSKHFAGEKISHICIIIVGSRSLKGRFNIVRTCRPAKLTSGFKFDEKSSENDTGTVKSRDEL
jgi:hypothetical protein